MTGRITHARLLELIRYEPETGLFFATSQRGRLPAGSPIGNKGNHGYIQLAIDKRMYLGHRVAWLYMTGEWPSHQVDHRNGKKTDNRWANLRSATCSQNMMNTPLYSRNKSGFRGVSWNARSKKWYAFIKADGHQTWLGSFNRAEDASEAYRKASRQVFGEFERKQA